VTDAAIQFSKANPIWGTGRRKSATARVHLMPGDGKILINKREVNDYFAEEKDRQSVLSPLVATDTLTSYNIGVNVKGGGTTGQADAVKLGIARALRKADPSLEQRAWSSGRSTARRAHASGSSSPSGNVPAHAATSRERLRHGQPGED